MRYTRPTFKTFEKTGLPARSFEAELLIADNDFDFYLFVTFSKYLLTNDKLLTTTISQSPER